MHLDPQHKCRGRLWAWEHIIGYHLVPQPAAQSKANLDFIERKQVKNVQGAIACGQLCIDEESFVCRSALYNASSAICELTNLNRHTIDTNQAESWSTKDTRLKFVQAMPTSHELHYMENKCFDEPRKFCEFRPLKNQRLKTVDSSHVGVQSAGDCRELCLASSAALCKSYQFESAGGVCRLSHLSELTSWHIRRPYSEQEGAVTYEIGTCYNGKGGTRVCKCAQLINWSVSVSVNIV